MTLNPEIVLWGIYTREMKSYVCIKISTQMFIAVLFVIAKTCNHMFFKQWVIKQNAVHPYDWIPVSNKIFLKSRMNYWYMYNLDESLDNCSGWKSQTQIYFSMYISFFQWQNYRNGYQIFGCKGMYVWWRRTRGILVVIGMFCAFTISMSIPWLWYCTIIFWHVISEENWVKCTQTG